jgi:cell division initiation protein
MSLSPVELKHQRPRRRLLGYGCEEVDRIMVDATAAYETVWRDRANLEDRVHYLETQLTEVRTMEDALRDALVTAQHTADEMRAQAGKDAELIVREAEARARDLVHRAYAERETIRREVEQLRAEEQRFRARLRSLLGSTLQTVRDHEEQMADTAPAPQLTAPAA